MNTQKQKLGMAVLGVFALILFVSLCLIFGAHNQSRVYAQIADQRAIVRRPLNYGQQAPDSTIAFLTGGTAKLSSFQGHWVLLVFADPECDACFSELDSLTKISPMYSDTLTVIPIIEAHSLVAPKVIVAKTLTAQHHYPYALASDDGTVGNQFGCGKGYPYAVLLDPQGKCRLTMQGFVRTPHKSQLACAIKSYFHGDFYNCLPETKWRQFAISPDVTFSINGKPTRLSDLSQNKVVMVTLFTGNTQFEAERVRAIKSYSEATNMLFICVGDGPNSLPTDLQGPNVLRVEENTKSIFAAFADNRPNPGPVSILVYHLSRFASERGAASDPTAFENAIAYSVYLSASPNLSLGFPVP